ncbi:MAG: hypothetical protein Q9169_000381 [Polycauliona sp. 2 TL-2023]
MLLNAKLSLLSSTILLFMLSNIIGASDIDHALQHRQNNIPVGTGVSASNASPSNSPTAATSAAAPNSPTPSPDNPSESPSPASPEQTTSDEANDNPSPSATGPSSSPTQEGNQATTTAVQGPTSSGSQPTITSPSDGDSSTADQTVSRSVSSQTQQFVTTVVTVSGSSTRTSVSTGSTVVPVATSSVTTTRNPAALNENEGGSNTSGLDDSQKRIVIGVVVGIGGAILLGGIAIVAWRIWGRKPRTADDDNDLMASHPGSSGHEKHSSVSGQSPFRSTLDQYHNQTGPVNTASNF